ncbi:MAG: plasmid mobilization protein [Sphingomonadaceae bacterium]
MKTDRLTLLINPADKAAINARAALLGISVSELVRRAALDYEPEEAAIRAEIEAILPEASAAIERMAATFDRMLAKAEAHHREMQWMRSPEGCEQIRRDLLSDPDIDWNYVTRALEDIRDGRYKREPA